MARGEDHLSPYLRRVSNGYPELMWLFWWCVVFSVVVVVVAAPAAAAVVSPILAIWFCTEMGYTPNLHF